MTASTPAPSALVRPFTVAIPDSEIEDLKRRLARTRWPNPETVPDWSQGVRLENAKSLIGYWEREYDWRRFESELDRFPHFLTTVATRPDFFRVCSSLAEVGLGRPFYPARGVAGMTRAAHALALGFQGAHGLSRACDRATAERPAGAPLF